MQKMPVTRLNGLIDTPGMISANCNVERCRIKAWFLQIIYATACLLVMMPAHAETLIGTPQSFADLLAARTKELTVHAWPGRQPIYIFDFPGLGSQGLTFNRVGALTERMSQGDARVLDDAELARFIRSLGKTAYTFAYGNDFLVSELVIFFNLSEHAAIPLNPEEQKLGRFLQDQGLMRERFGFWQALKPNAVILSIPQENPGGDQPPVSALARRTILTHELAHAEYYTNPEYRTWCMHFWRQILDERQRGLFRSFLSRSGYDASNEDLIINETQAYLSFTPDPRAFNAKMIGLNDSELERLRQAFRRGAPAWPIERNQ